MSRNITFATDEYYHLYNRGSDKRIIFLDTRDYERFMCLLYLCNNVCSIYFRDYRSLAFADIFKIKRGEKLVDIGAYCLMSNHFHVLVKELRPDGISRFMQKLITSYTMYFNTRHTRSGVLFQGKFKAKHIQNDNYMKYLFSYIHLNPVKIIDSDWKDSDLKTSSQHEHFLNKYDFSSYKDYLNFNRPERNILSVSSFPEYFDEKLTFRKFIKFWLEFKDAE